MFRKVIEIENCSVCPYKLWNENYKTSECTRKNNKVIYAIDKIPAWCPLPEIPERQVVEDQRKIA